MRSQRLALIITIVNSGFLILTLSLLTQIRPILASDGASVLRGRGLEIVDDQGRVRASISVLPADPTRTLPSGKTVPETVLLRLIDQNGSPLKLSASDQGAILVLGGSDRSYAQLKAEGGVSSLRLVNNDGREQLTRP